MQSDSIEDPFAPLTCEMHAMLSAFNELAVPHIVVGGFAVRVHGFLRAVEDLDLVIETTDESLVCLSRALRSLHVEKVDEVVALFRRRAPAKWRWCDGRVDNYVDLLSQVDGHIFGAIAEDCVLVSVDNMKVPVLSRQRLIASKRNLAVNTDFGDVDRFRLWNPSDNLPREFDQRPRN